MPNLKVETNLSDCWHTCPNLLSKKTVEQKAIV